ncbi:uncharacterized protein LOC135844641 isoform X2 [Planococcus citri]|uniref:uncharacterized protein LOC135844641 isoform X2 n=1 Tax=Planococcus citri TaxID=170843 RepID=UPI0031FA1390
MNNILLICGIFLMGIISANVEPVQSSTPPNDAPSLSCILFKELGCRVQCTSIMKLQDFSQSSASCNDEQACTCTINSESLDTLWNKKFDADDVLRQIKQNGKLVEKVTRVLENASRTSEQSKQDLQAILPKQLFSKIQVKNDTTKINVGEIRKIVDNEVKSLVQFLNSPEVDATDLDYLNWVDNFYTYLDGNKENASIQSVYHQVGLAKNDVLKELLDFYLEEEGTPQIDRTIKYKQDNVVAQMVANRLINGMINKYGLPKITPSPDTSLD